MARIAASGSAASAEPVASLRHVLFLRPLCLGTTQFVDVVLKASCFEICSRNESLSIQPQPDVHCSGATSAPLMMEFFDEQQTHCLTALHNVHAPAAYHMCFSAGLQYGPIFRNITSAWVSDNILAAATARLVRRYHRGSQSLHPADLDGALQLGAILAPPAGSQTRLPFAVDSTQLDAVQLEYRSDSLSAVHSKLDVAHTVQLAKSRSGRLMALLEGFRSRTLTSYRGATVPHHQYVTLWKSRHEPALDGNLLNNAYLLVCWKPIVGSALQLTACPSISCERKFEQHLGACKLYSAIVFVDGVHQQLRGLVVAERALQLLQAHSNQSPLPAVWLLTGGVQKSDEDGRLCPHHAGLWGLARAARAEISSVVRCVDAPAFQCLEAAVFDQYLHRFSKVEETEPEIALHKSDCRMPRLAHAPATTSCEFCVHLPARGAISNLTVDQQDGASFSEDPSYTTLRVCAVGLNFRDVLNVLGEYPGDPGPPGGDCAGVCTTSCPNLAPDHACFGIGHAPLASKARASVLLVVAKPQILTFEASSTLPVTWLTTHVVLGQSVQRAGCSLLVHAAAGGVGLKAVEYAKLLGLQVLGSAGRPCKHQALFASFEHGFKAWLCSSRSGGAFASGMTHLMQSKRCHAALNSRPSEIEPKPAWCSICRCVLPAESLARSPMA
eukprot:7388437-Prymnesium_polylepis.1